MRLKDEFLNLQTNLNKIKNKIVTSQKTLSNNVFLGLNIELLENITLEDITLAVEYGYKEFIYETLKNNNSDFENGWLSQEEENKLLEDFLNSNKYKDYPLTIKINLNKRKLNCNQIDIINQSIKKIAQKHKIKKVKIISDARLFDVNEKTPYIFTKEEFNDFGKINNTLNELNLINCLCFNELDSNDWSYREVLRANDMINNIVNKIREYNFSPYEALIYIHSWCANIKYKKNEKNRESEITIVGYANNEDILCVGYSYLIKAICDNLNMPGLKAKVNFCKFTYENDDRDRHAQNLIEIKDSKYNISGTYREDACLDCKTQNRDFTFTYFLNSMSDIKNTNNLKEYIIDIVNYDILINPYKLKYTIDEKNNCERMKTAEEKLIENEKLKNLTEAELQLSSPVISLEVFKSGYKNVLNKIGNIQDIDTQLTKIINDSARRSLDFKPNSQNIFRKYANEQAITRNNQEYQTNLLAK